MVAAHMVKSFGKPPHCNCLNWIKKTCANTAIWKSFSLFTHFFHFLHKKQASKNSELAQSGTLCVSSCASDLKMAFPLVVAEVNRNQFSSVLKQQEGKGGVIVAPLSAVIELLLTLKPLKEVESCPEPPHSPHDGLNAEPTTTPTFYEFFRRKFTDRKQVLEILGSFW